MRRRTPEQAALFPTEDLVIPETLRNMRKAVAAIHATPLRAEHSQSLNSRRLFDACILVAQLDFRNRDPMLLQRIRQERVSPMFETRIGDLCRLAGIAGKNYQRVYRELDQLFEMVLSWNIVGEDAEVAWQMKSHFLSTLGAGKGHKRGMVRFSIDPSILEIVLEPANWATLSLQAMEGLQTAASYALYQNAWRYVNTNAKVTAALPAATWVELLMGKSRYVVEDGDGAKRVVNYGDFKRRVLLDAIRRVNEVSALSYSLELREIKLGTRVVKLQFRFKAKQNLSLGLPLTWPRDMLALLAQIGLTNDQVSDLSQLHSQEVVAEALLRLQEAETRLRALNRPIVSRAAYFNGILANIAAGEAAAAIDLDRIEQEERAREEALKAQERQARVAQAFTRHQVDVLGQRLLEIPSDERNALLGEFENTAEGAAVRKNLLQKRDWSEKPVGAISVLKTWLAKQHPAMLERLLPAEHDRSQQAWMEWRLARDVGDG